jgi:TetR/AcrR family transcriptional regulator
VTLDNDLSAIAWPGLADQVAAMQAEGLVTRTFRRLDTERQLAVIHAILEQMAERGPDDLSIKDVAEQAEVSVGSLYQYFINRDRMLTFAVQLCRRYLDTVIDDSLPYFEDLALPEALTAYVQGGLAWCQQQPSLVRLFARAAYRGDSSLTEDLVRPAAATMHRAVQRLLERAIARGELRPDIDLQATAGLIHSLTILLTDTLLLPYLDAYFHVQLDQSDPSRVLRAALDLVIRGLGTTALDGSNLASER